MTQVRATIWTVVTLVVAFAVIVTLVVVVARRGRDDFGEGRIDDLTSAIEARGLVVCSATSSPGNGNSGSISSEQINVARPDGCGDAITVQVDGYSDADARDAAARNAEAATRPRRYGTVFTWKQYTIYLQGDDASGDAGIRDDLVAAIDSVGAR